MSVYNFYEIKSQKSREYVNGLRQVSLVCGDHPEIHCFLWIDEKDELKHMQFLFNEKLIEWFDDRKQLVAAFTNRQFQQTQKTGIQKGARTIHEVADNSILVEGINIIKASDFPNAYGKLIHHSLSDEIA